MTRRNPLDELGTSLGEFLREQRLQSRLSLRQLSDLAGVSNPYLSQIERGLKRPSAEILQQLAKALQVSSETLYVQAGILERPTGEQEPVPTVALAIAADTTLTDRQKQTLLDVYESFVGAPGAQASTDAAPATTSTTRPRATKSATKSPAKSAGKSTKSTTKVTAPEGAAAATTRSTRTRATRRDASPTT
ncbi:MAG: helix-turn-helix domain-containing protein [Micrococcales bacterium]|nr:helix-turn-helix domain-containing protein [Micrococcales bacterium]